jgi:ribonuclease Z
MKVTILGASSAIQSPTNFNSSQVVSLNDRAYLIDCGEGTQIKLRQFYPKTSRLQHIFISHLHGDHCFGLVGLISSMAMMGRTNDLHIYAHVDLETLLQPHIAYFCVELPFQVTFHAINPREHALIFEDKNLSVYTLPLKHGIPTCGFLFEEKPKERHIIREKTAFYQVPLKDLPALKAGNDWVSPSGEIVSNAQLTKPAEAPKRYAYCSDTAYYEKLIPMIESVDCLFHEATFVQKDIARAKQNNHSTAQQAAEIAKKAQVKKLIIGHFSSRYPNPQVLLEEAKAVFANSFSAREGDEISI